MDAKQETITSLKKGTWSPQEDSLLINYIAVHGEGRWNYVARDSGLNRTGKSCRLRWKNYLQPNVRRGNFTAEEELRMAELHCIYGNRWSRIAEFLPGRTDNEIKNYWRSRVHKQAKQLKYDTKSEELREFVRNIWLPRLSQQIQCNNFINSDIGRSVTMMNSHENLQMEGAHQDMNMSNNNIGCGLYSPMAMASQMELGQHSYNEDLPSPACFSYGELSNMLLNDDWYI